MNSPTGDGFWKQYGIRPGPAQPPTHRDVKYGPHDRNVMDVWLAKSDKPMPVLVSSHGGGFSGGNKSISGDLLRQCLDSGISAVAITHRLSGEAKAPAQFHDAARAIQFIRFKAKESRFALPTPVVLALLFFGALRAHYLQNPSIFAARG